jgi:WD40 repeat protein
MKIVKLASDSPPTVIEPPLRTNDARDAFRNAHFYDDVHLIASSVHGRLIIYDSMTGQQVDEIHRWGGSIDGLTANARHNEIAYSNSNRVSVFSGTIEKKDWHERIELLFRSGEDHAHDVALSGKLMAVAHGDHTISLWDTWRPGLKARLTGGEGIEATCAVFHPHGKRLFTGSRRGQVTEWQVGTWKKLRSWEAHTTQVSHVTISPDGEVLATSGPDRTIVLWDSATGQELRVHPGLVWPVPVSFSSDGLWYAIPGDQFAANQILINDVGTGNPIATIPTPKSTYPRGLMPFSPDGSTILTK